MKLTDFTSAQLDTLLMAVANRMVENGERAKAYERNGLYLLDGFKKNWEEARSETQNCETLIIQILNAQQIVKRFETVSSN